MRWPRFEVLAALLIGGACAGHPPVRANPADAAVADQLAALVTAALEADGGTARVDSLYASDAEIIADGHRRTASPRYAGVGERGRVVVGSSRVDVAGDFAWASLRYQWFSADENRITEGQATLVLLRGADRKAWHIVHAHSSQSR